MVSAAEVSLALVRADVESTVPDRFEHVAGLVPDRPALSGDGRAWTFDTLNRDANRLAHAVLDRTGAGPGRIVCLLPASPDMVVATLGILKAGKTYTAIHPRTPVAGQSDLLRDVAPQLLLTTRALRKAAETAVAGACPVLVLDDLPPSLDSTNPRRRVSPRDPSTLFYTSGSTGRPKGVVKSHRAVLHRAWLSTHHDAITPADRQSLLTHVAFSASESDMFAALLQGASVHTFDVSAHALAEFRSWLEDTRITLLHPPALYFRRFLATLEGADLFPDVRLVALAGDVVLPADLARWRRHFSSRCVVLHRFSITETALLAVARFDRHSLPRGPIVEAGRPVSNKDLRIVDDRGADVPVGETGELVVYSDFLADGYFGRPDETAAAFGVDADGRRFYRTGDRGRFEADGTFVFLGRNDHQVKIRGFRVDIREIESALLEIDEVAETACVAWRDDAAEQRLSAFLVCRTGRDLSPRAARARLLERLPEWKVPSDVHVIDALPTTLTGKPDRKALETWAAQAAGRVDAEPIPRSDGTSIEDEVVRLVARVLRVPSVARDENFFDLGGNSLLVTELHLELENRLGRPVPLRDLLRAPTVADMAALVASTTPVRSSTADPNLVTLRSGPEGSALFLVHGGLGIPPSAPRLLDGLATGQAVYAFRASGFDASTAPFEDVPAMAAAYVAAMRRRQPAGPYRLGAICAGAVVAFEMAAQLLAAGERVSPLVLVDPPLPSGELPWTARVPRLLLLQALLPLRRSWGLARLVMRALGTPFRSVAELGVWLQFRRASYRHRLRPLPLDVFVVGTDERLRPFGEGRWARLLKGRVRVFTVGAGHRAIFDPHNEDAERCCREAVRAAQAIEADRDAEAASAAVRV